MDWTEAFVENADDALKHFEVVRMTNNGIHAEASTGSKYVVYVVDQVDNPLSSDKAVVIAQPWQAVYYASPGAYIHPGYFIQKWGYEGRGRTLDRYHGGDVYALLKCVEELIGIVFTPPEELFS